MFQITVLFTDSFPPLSLFKLFLQTISTKDAEGFDLKGCLKDLQAAHHSDSESEGGERKDAGGQMMKTTTLLLQCTSTRVERLKVNLGRKRYHSSSMKTRQR